MDSKSDINISDVLNVSDIKSIIQDVVRLIGEVAGQRSIFECAYTNPGKNIQKIKIINSSEQAEVASITAHINAHTHLVKKCTCFFENKVVELTSKGDMMDYLFLSLCPSMCIVRSIMYMIEICKYGMDPLKVDDQLRVDTKTNLTQTNICIYGKDDAFVELQLSRDLSHFVCFPNGKERGIPFKPFLSIENTAHAWYLEKAFANQHSDNKNAVPCPQTLQAMEIIFNLIGVDYAAKQQPRLSQTTLQSQARIHGAGKTTLTPSKAMLGG
jgi:hypothetical protein